MSDCGTQFNQLIVDLYKSQKLEKAEILSKKLIEKHTKEVFIYNLLGLILTSQNKDDEAIKYYEEGLKINSKFPEIYNNLGKSKGNFKKTIVFF